MKNKILTSLLLLFSFMAFSNCSNDDDPIKAHTFVLVHGAWQATFVWEKVKAGIEKSGQKVVVIELPAHGNDKTPPQNVSIDVYRDVVVNKINAMPESVILVGHSLGGMVITAVAEKIPGKIEKLVYVGAFLPADNQSLLDLANSDAQSLLGPSLIPSADQLTLDVKHDNIISIFCEDASADDKALILQKFRVEPAIPFTDKVAITADNFGKVDKYYIKTLNDHAVGIDLQNRMLTAANITKTYSMNTSHCPFLSQPNELKDLLLKIAK